MPSDAKKREKEKKKKADKERQQKNQTPGKSKLDKGKTDDKSPVTVDKTEEIKGSGDSGDDPPQHYETASGAEGNKERVPKIDEVRTGATATEGKQDIPRVQRNTTMAQDKKSIMEELNQPENQNWVKAGLCFYEAKEVLLHFVTRDWTETKPATDCDISPILTFVIDSRKYQQQQFGYLQDSARKVRHDRNDYIHERPQPKVTNAELNRFKSNIINLLKNQMLRNTGKTELAQKRIDEICTEKYIISPKDEYTARLSNIEGQVNTHKEKIPLLEKEINSIRDLLKKFENFRDSSELETKLKMVEMSLMKVIKDHGDKITMLESQVYDIQDRQGQIHNAVGYLLMREPDIQKRKRSEDHVNMLRNTADWNPVSECGEVELMSAANEDNLILVDLLINEGVPLNMKYIPLIKSAKGLLHIIQNMQNSGIWEPESSFATDALENALLYQIPELENILASNGVNVTASEYE